MTEWVLPASPDSEDYLDLLSDVSKLEQDEALAATAAIAEEDFWFFCWQVSSLRNHEIADPRHPNVGELYIEQPFMFEQCRKLQHDWETWAPNPFYNWARYHYKTTLVTILRPLWATMKDVTMTTAILTYKIDKIGETMFGGYRKELEENPMMRACWPDIVPEEGNFPELTKTKMTLKRDPGIREPTFSLHALAFQPVSFHVRHMIIDDAEVKESVTNQVQIAECISNMRRSVALETADCRRCTVGTIWDRNGPYLEIDRQGGFFGRRDWITCFGPAAEVVGMDDETLTTTLEDGTTVQTTDYKVDMDEIFSKNEPCLHSNEMIQEWRGKMDEYEASAQLIGAPVAKARQQFMDEWMFRYLNDPHKERQGKNVYFFVDFTGDGDGDMFALHVLGLGYDELYYSLDLHREDYGLTAGIDLIFRLVKVWRPECVFIEEFGASGYYETIMSEMSHRKFRFVLQRLPKLKRSKTQRIQNLQAMMKKGLMYFPHSGYGHPSANDQRDVLQQLLADEYRLWSPLRNATLTDDMLDVLSWPAQDEVRAMLDFPEDHDPDNPHALENRFKQKTYADGLSGWVL